MADAVMFVDGPEFVLVLPQLDTDGNILTKFKKNPTSGLGGDAITRNVYRRSVGLTDGRRPVRKAPLDYVQKSYYYQKGPSKGPSNLDSRYPSMPEPAGGLGGPLVPRPTGISSNTCPGNSNIPEYAYNITC